MISFVRVRRIELSTGASPTDAAHPTGARRLSLADKAAIAVLGIGLLALGGVLLAAGLALLIGLTAVGTVIGAGAVIRHRLVGRSRPTLGPDEIAADAVVSESARPAGSLPAGSDSTTRRG
jgi:hypothetical protein